MIEEAPPPCQPLASTPTLMGERASTHTREYQKQVNIWVKCAYLEMATILSYLCVEENFDFKEAVLVLFFPKVVLVYDMSIWDRNLYTYLRLLLCFPLPRYKYI